MGGEWRTASHVARQAKAKKTETPPPPKPLDLHGRVSKCEVDGYPGRSGRRR